MTNASDVPEPWHRRILWLVIGAVVTVVTTALIARVTNVFVGVFDNDAIYSSARPGCESASSRVEWILAKSTVELCDDNGTTLRKDRAWRGFIADDNGELQFRQAGRTFPAAYHVSVSVSTPTDSDPTSEGACAGFSVHTNAAGTTFEELSVCGSGKVALIGVRNGEEIARGEKWLPYTGTFKLRADVAPTRTTLTVDNGQGVTTALTSDAIAQTTSYVGLTIFWKSAGATARFADFEYRDA